MKIYTSSRKINIPRDQNLTELLHCTAYDLPESHLVATDNLTNRSITLGQLRERAGRIAAGLASQLSPLPDQARWALSLPNSVEFLEAVHAILWTGGVVCPVNHALKPAEIGHGLAVSRPHYVVAYGPALPAMMEAVEVARAELAAQGVEWSRPVVLTMITRPSSSSYYSQPSSSSSSSSSSSASASSSSASASSSSAKPIPHIPDDSGFFPATRLPIPHWDDTTTRLATIHLSSGTTGKPKGVQLTHHNFVANVHQLVAHDAGPAASFTPASRTVAFTPWVHIGSTTMPLFLGPYAGMLHHAMPQFGLEQFARIAASVRATNYQGVPSVVLALATGDVVGKYGLDAHARTIQVGSLPLSKELLGKLYGRAPWRLVRTYGMTEAAGYVAYQRLRGSGEEGTLADDDGGEGGIVGELLPNIEACLKVEGTATDAPPGGPGELWLRGPNITGGYAFNEDANRKSFHQPGGWYNTGDVCTIDSRGRLGIVGRTKELIKYKGFQVSPGELEPLVQSHPDVVEAGVGPTWDEAQLTELPTAWVVLAERCKGLSEQERKLVLNDVREFVDARVSGYKKLRGGVWHVVRIPRNPTGKIVRKEMAAMRGGVCSLDQPVLSGAASRAKL